MSDIVALWTESLAAAYGLAKGERLNELHGNYVKSRDGRGLHPYSEQWGRLRILEELEPVLAEDGVATDPVSMRKVARADAIAEFRAEILAAA